MTKIDDLVAPFQTLGRTTHLRIEDCSIDIIGELLRRGAKRQRHHDIQSGVSFTYKLKIDRVDVTLESTSCVTEAEARTAYYFGLSVSDFRRDKIKNQMFGRHNP